MTAQVQHEAGTAVTGRRLRPWTGIGVATTLWGIVAVLAGPGTPVVGEAFEVLPIFAVVGPVLLGVGIARESRS